MTKQQCTWERLPNVMDPLEPRPVRFKAGCNGVVLQAVHPIYPDVCFNCSAPVVILCPLIGDVIYCQCGKPSSHYGTMGQRGAREVKEEAPPKKALTSKKDSQTELLRWLRSDDAPRIPQLEQAALTIEQLQSRLKRHEPTSLYNGHDIDWWKAHAEQGWAALRHLLSHADRPRKELLWCTTAVEEADRALSGDSSAPETSVRPPNLVARLRRINAINDNPARYDSEIDKLTACGMFIAPDEYCELLIGHEGRCGLLPGSPRRSAQETSAPLTPAEMGTVARMAAVSAQVQPERASAECTGCGGKPEFPNIPCSICGMYPDGTYQ